MKTLFALASIGILVSGFTCQRNDFETSCSTTAIVRDLTGLDGCGFVFELANGTRLIPKVTLICGTPPLPKEVTEDPLYNFSWEDGKVVQISYQPVEDDVNVCMAGEVVKITCLKEVVVAEE